jgi:hypothetical protein
MGRKPKAGSDTGQKTQAERFIEAAQQAGADETGETFDEVFKKIVSPKMPKPGDEPKGDARTKLKRTR